MKSQLDKNILNAYALGAICSKVGKQYKCIDVSKNKIKVLQNISKILYNDSFLVRTYKTKGGVFARLNIQKKHHILNFKEVIETANLNLKNIYLPIFIQGGLDISGTYNKYNNFFYLKTNKNLTKVISNFSVIEPIKNIVYGTQKDTIIFENKLKLFSLKSKLSNLVNDMKDAKVGRLTILSQGEDFVSKSGRKDITWLCRCDCGNITTVRAANLRGKRPTMSCGCLASEISSKRLKTLNKNNTKYHPRIVSARAIWKNRYNDGDLSFDEFYHLSQQKCFYCGCNPIGSYALATESSKTATERYKKHSRFTYNGLDRVDSGKGHSKDNVVTCCKYCNTSKSNRELNEFLNWVKLIYTNLKNKNLI
jgi:hypothetical protein